MSSRGVEPQALPESLFNFNSQSTGVSTVLDEDSPADLSAGVHGKISVDSDALTHENERVPRVMNITSRRVEFQHCTARTGGVLVARTGRIHPGLPALVTVR